MGSKGRVAAVDVWLASSSTMWLGTVGTLETVVVLDASNRSTCVYH